MPEETTDVVETTSPPTGEEGQSYEQVLAGEGSAPEAVTEGDASQQVPQDKPDATQAQEIELAIGDQNFKGKQDLFAKALGIIQTLGDDGISALEGAEKIAELKKNYDKHFTQSNQKFAEEKKLYEEVFGYEPKPYEMQNLKSIIDGYRKDEQFAAILNGVISGKSTQDILKELSASQVDAQGVPITEQGNIDDLDPNTRALMSKIDEQGKTIARLQEKFESGEKERLSREEQNARAEQKKVWDGWVSGRQKADKDFEMNVDIDQTMGDVMPSLIAKNPDWDANKIYDEAYLRAMLIVDPDRVSKNVVDKTLKGADGLKKTNPPKVIPSSPTKTSDDDKSYGDIAFGQ